MPAAGIRVIALVVVGAPVGVAADVAVVGGVPADDDLAADVGVDRRSVL
jgi:hypothetical protein